MLIMNNGVIVTSTEFYFIIYFHFSLCSVTDFIKFESCLFTITYLFKLFFDFWKLPAKPGL